MGLELDGVLSLAKNFDLKKKCISQNFKRFSGDLDMIFFI
jgi:hypothetical protein